MYSAAFPVVNGALAQVSNRDKSAPDSRTASKTPLVSDRWKGRATSSSPASSHGCDSISTSYEGRRASRKESSGARISSATLPDLRTSTRHRGEQLGDTVTFMAGKPSGTKTGMGVAIGAGVGAALFAATSSPVWIAVGVAIGAAVGAASSQIDNSDSPDDDNP